jgi:hypothetical protein
LTARAASLFASAAVALLLAPTLARAQAPVPPSGEAPPAQTPAPAAEIAPVGDERPRIVSTSPVPATSILYPGSTVRVFQGTDNFGFQTDLDLRYRDANRETRGTYVTALRETFDWVRANPNNRDERGGFRAQLLLEADPSEDGSGGDGTGPRNVRTSEFYGYYTFLSGGVSARVRVGQFAMPFGLLAVYDAPFQLIQPLFAQSLGLRVDTGVMLEGAYGPYKYAGAVTTGSGPNRTSFGGKKTFTFRLSRTVPTKKYGTFEVGGSLLSGRLPITTYDYALPPSGTPRARSGYVEKTRFAGDGQYSRGPVTLRGELVFGGDDADAVSGYFAQGEYRFADRLTVTGYRKRWSFPVKPQADTITGVGLNYAPRRDLVIRFLYEYERSVPASESGTPFVIKRLTLQSFLSF